jgi:hypothetical protein
MIPFSRRQWNLLGADAPRLTEEAMAVAELEGRLITEGAGGLGAALLLSSSLRRKINNPDVDSAIMKKVDTAQNARTA